MQPPAALSQRLAAALSALTYTSPEPASAPDAARLSLGLLAPDEADADAASAQPDLLCPRQLRSRLRSFRPGLWSGRPAAVDALAAALRGWCAVSAEADLLQCCACCARFAWTMPPGWSPQQAASAAQQLAPRLASAHTDSCVWRASSTPAEAAAFPPLPQALLADAFHRRLQSLQRLTRLPRTAEPPAAAAPRVAHLAGEQEGEGEAGRERAQSAADAVFVALCGWEASPCAPPSGSSAGEGGEKSEASGTLSCACCAARLGLWNYPLGWPPSTAQWWAERAASERLSQLSQPSRSSAASSAFATGGGLHATLAMAAGGGGGAGLTIAGGAGPSGGSAGSAGPFGRKRPSNARSHPEPAAKAARPSGILGEPLDPIGAHRPFCSWVLDGGGDETSAKPSALTPGWARTLDALLPPPLEVEPRVESVAREGRTAEGGALTPAAARLLVSRLLRPAAAGGA
jgi:hypothetical protein